MEKEQRSPKIVFDKNDVSFPNEQECLKLHPSPNEHLLSNEQSGSNVQLLPNVQFSPKAQPLIIIELSGNFVPAGILEQRETVSPPRALRLNVISPKASVDENRSRWGNFK